MSSLTVAPTEAGIEQSTRVVRLALTWVLLLPLLFFAVRGKFSFEGRDSADTLAALSAHNSSTIGTVGGVLSYFIVAVLVATRMKAVIQVSLKMRWMTSLAVLTVLSSMWSQDPAKSFFFGTCYVLSTLLAYYLVVRLDFDQLLQLLMVTGVAACLASLIFVIVIPQYAIPNDDPRSPGAWIGIFQIRTGASQVLCFLLGPGLVIRRSGLTWLQVAYVVMIIFFIMMSRPVTGLILMCLYIACMGALYLFRRFQRKTALALGFAVIPSMLLLFAVGLSYLGEFLQLFGRDMTFTGRTVIWQSLLLSIAKRPLLGYGYQAFWQGLNGESANAILSAHWIFSYAHNGLLEIVLQVGLIGLVLVLITLVKAFRDGWFCLKYGNSAGVEWCFGLLLLTCMYNFDEETLLFPKDLLTVLYIVACTALALRASRIRQELALRKAAETSAQSLAAFGSRPLAEAAVNRIDIVPV